MAEPAKVVEEREAGNGDVQAELAEHHEALRRHIDDTQQVPETRLQWIIRMVRDAAVLAAIGVAIYIVVMLMAWR